jgi:DNA mismatch repair protein MutS
MPPSVVERARELLRELEANGHAAPPPAADPQLTLFAPEAPHPALDRLRAVDVDRTTPLEALSLLAELARAAQN